MGFLDDYEPVENRLRDFWTDHPKGRVTTKLLHHEDGDYIVIAKVWRDAGESWAAATGLAHDSTATLPNNMKASALEVCETSAIGRALANLGYAPKGKRPSREEMQKSRASGTRRGEGQQDAEVPITERTTDPIPVPNVGGAAVAQVLGEHPARSREVAGSSPVSGPPTSTSVPEGEAGADDSEGEVASLGGTSRATSPEESPWAGMGVD